MEICLPPCYTVTVCLRWGSDSIKSANIEITFFNTIGKFIFSTVLAYILNGHFKAHFLDDIIA